VIFIDASPTQFHAADALAASLRARARPRWSEKDPWTLEPGKAYYVSRNGSGLIAFRLGRIPPSQSGFALPGPIRTPPPCGNCVRKRSFGTRRANGGGGGLRRPHPLHLAGPAPGPGRTGGGTARRRRHRPASGQSRRPRCGDPEPGDTPESGSEQGVRVQRPESPAGPGGSPRSPTGFPRRKTPPGPWLPPLAIWGWMYGIYWGPSFSWWTRPGPSSWAGTGSL
jgi:hypothetical protein